MTNILMTSEYEKDVKSLKKKYASLESDLELFYKALRVIRKVDIRGTVRVSKLGEKYKNYPVYKVRSFRCKSLKGQGAKSGIRVIYYDNIVDDTLTLIQIYHKSTTEECDLKRISRHLDSIINDEQKPTSNT